MIRHGALFIGKSLSKHSWMYKVQIVIMKRQNKLHGAVTQSTTAYKSGRRDL